MEDQDDAVRLVEETAGTTQSKSQKADAPSTTTAQQQAASGGSSNAGGKGQGSAANANAGGNNVVTVSETDSSAGSDAGSQATVIAVLGHEVIGTNASSNGGSSESTTGLAQATCPATDGSLCVALLYGQATADETNAGSASSADAVIASLCAGGEQQDPGAECDAPIDVSVGESHSAATNGETASAERSSTVADACVGGSSDAGICEGIGVSVLHEESTSDTQATGHGLSLQAGGEERITLDHPGGIAPGCPEESPDNCIEFNSGSAEAANAGGAGAERVAGGTSSATAEGKILDVVIGGQEVVTASGTNAQTSSEGSSADVTVLSILGHEIVGAHAASDGGTTTSETGYLTESCEVSDGQLCVALLWGQATASENAQSSNGKSDAALASACAGGEQTDPTEECDGPVGLTVAESHSNASQDKGSGAAEADEKTTGADLCLGGENQASGTCEGLGVTVLDAESHSSAAPGEKGKSSADAETVTIEAGGEEVLAVDAERDIAVPPGCPDAGALACVTLNQVDTSAAAGSANAGSGALDTTVVRSPQGDLIQGQVSEGETSAEAAESRVLGRQARRDEAQHPALPTTGSSVAQIFMLALVLVAAGALLRRMRTKTEGEDARG